MKNEKSLKYNVANQLTIGKCSSYYAKLLVARITRYAVLGLCRGGLPITVIAIVYMYRNYRWYIIVTGCGQSVETAVYPGYV